MSFLDLNKIDDFYIREAFKQIEERIEKLTPKSQTITQYPQNINYSKVENITNNDNSSTTVIDNYDGDTLTDIVDVNVFKGQVAFIKSNGHFGLAINDKKGVGLFADNYTIGQTANIITSGRFELSDWTNVTGSTTLTIGDDYYVSIVNPGELTNIEPTTEGTYLLKIGTAIDTLTLNVDIKIWIKL